MEAVVRVLPKPCTQSLIDIHFSTIGLPLILFHQELPLNSLSNGLSNDSLIHGCEKSSEALHGEDTFVYKVQLMPEANRCQIQNIDFLVDISTAFEHSEVEPVVVVNC